jgi:Gram-negative bacterial TonB protein C-terminal
MHSVVKYIQKSCVQSIVIGISLYWLTAAPCIGQALCPRHIETPIYPPSAQVARVQWKITLRLTIGADGTVQKVEALNDPKKQVQPILVKYATDNLLRWTFEKPLSAPVTQTITYEYRFDGSLPINDHQNPITKVNIDLPDYVTILSNEVAINPSRARKRKL